MSFIDTHAKRWLRLWLAAGLWLATLLGGQAWAVNVNAYTYDALLPNWYKPFQQAKVDSGAAGAHLSVTMIRSNSGIGGFDFLDPPESPAPWVVLNGGPSRQIAGSDGKLEYWAGGQSVAIRLLIPPGVGIAASRITANSLTAKSYVCQGLATRHDPASCTRELDAGSALLWPIETKNGTKIEGRIEEPRIVTLVVTASDASFILSALAVDWWIEGVDNVRRFLDWRLGRKWAGSVGDCDGMQGDYAEDDGIGGVCNKSADGGLQAFALGAPIAVAGGQTLTVSGPDGVSLTGCSIKGRYPDGKDAQLTKYDFMEGNKAQYTLPAVAGEAVLEVKCTDSFEREATRPFKLMPSADPAQWSAEALGMVATPGARKVKVTANEALAACSLLNTSNQWLSHGMTLSKDKKTANLPVPASLSAGTSLRAACLGESGKLAAVGFTVSPAGIGTDTGTGTGTGNSASALALSQTTDGKIRVTPQPAGKTVSSCNVLQADGKANDLRIHFISDGNDWVSRESVLDRAGETLTVSCIGSDLSPITAKLTIARTQPLVKLMVVDGSARPATRAAVQPYRDSSTPYPRGENGGVRLCWVAVPESTTYDDPEAAIDQAMKGVKAGKGEPPRGCGRVQQIGENPEKDLGVLIEGLTAAKHTLHARICDATQCLSPKASAKIDKANVSNKVEALQPSYAVKVNSDTNDTEVTLRYRALDEDGWQSVRVYLVLELCVKTPSSPIGPKGCYPSTYVRRFYEPGSNSQTLTTGKAKDWSRMVSVLPAVLDGTDTLHGKRQWLSGGELSETALHLKTQEFDALLKAYELRFWLAYRRADGVWRVQEAGAVCEKGQSGAANTCSISPQKTSNAPSTS